MHPELSRRLQTSSQSRHQHCSSATCKHSQQSQLRKTRQLFSHCLLIFLLVSCLMQSDQAVKRTAVMHLFAQKIRRTIKSWQKLVFCEESVLNVLDFVLIIMYASLMQACTLIANIVCCMTDYTITCEFYICFMISISTITTTEPTVDLALATYAQGCSHE